MSSGFQIGNCYSYRSSKLVEKFDNFESNQSISFTSTLDGSMVYKYFNNLIINAGHTITTTNRCKGLYIYVAGDAIINGSLTMTARGAKVAGENLVLMPEIGKLVVDANYVNYPYYIGAVGGAAKAGFNNIVVQAPTTNGNAGVNYACGSGGAGALNTGVTNSWSGGGSAGTSYSGGAGGGACMNTGAGTAGSGGVNGGAGGNAVRGLSTYGAGGGAGNPGGAGIGGGGTGGTGTGGLLILVVKGTLTVSGIISSNGSAGGTGSTTLNPNNTASGGGSGGGSVNVFYKSLSNYNSIQALAGPGGTITGSQAKGGDGGAGTVRTVKLWS